MCKMSIISFCLLYIFAFVAIQALAIDSNVFESTEWAY